MFDDEFSFGIVREVIIPEDGAVVELRQAVNAYLMCLHIHTVCDKLSNKFIECNPLNKTTRAQHKSPPTTMLPPGK